MLPATRLWGEREGDRNRLGAARGQGDAKEGDLGGGGLLDGGEDARVVRAGDVDGGIRRKIEAGDIEIALVDGLLNRAEVGPEVACEPIEGCRPEVHEIATGEGQFHRELIGSGRDLILEVAGTAATGKLEEVKVRNREAAATRLLLIQL